MDKIDKSIIATDGETRYEGLQAQVNAEYLLGYDHLQGKITTWLARMRLYNNQKRDQDAVGDTTLFTVCQTVIASLYMDRLTSEWAGREEGDEETAENLDALADYDYDEMKKYMTDYDWIWDAVFFGRGILSFQEYIRNPKKNIFLPVPEVIDPTTFLRDPLATSINGTLLAKNAARFFGRELRMTRDQIETNTNMFKELDFENIKYGKSTRSLMERSKEERDAAQGRENQKNKGEAGLATNAQYDVLEWYTHFKEGDTIKKVKCWLTNEAKKIIGVKEIGKVSDLWPVIDRPLYPTSHDWDGTSVPDLIEDKQRARAIAQNLGLKMMESDLYPSYVFDQNRITNRHDLDFNINKFIPVNEGDVRAAIAPLQKAHPDMALLNFIYTTLDISGQKATATPDIKMGMQSQADRPLGETNLIASNTDTRYSLSAKIFGWSEKEFWLQWYRMYKENFKEKIDEKVVRLVGAFGAKWRPLTKKDIITPRLDPDVKIESQVISRAKQLEERMALTNYFTLAFQDENTNKRYGLKRLGKLNGMKKDELERLFPPTIDERIAEDENDVLNEDKVATIRAEDDHNTHLEIHSKAKDTNATMAHIEAHKRALSIKKVNPELFPEEPITTAFQQPGTNKMPTPNQPKMKPMMPSQTSNTIQ